MPHMSHVILNTLKGLTYEIDTGGRCSLKPFGNIYLMCHVSRVKFNPIQKIDTGD